MSVLGQRRLYAVLQALEVGTFEVPKGSTPSWAEMVMLLDGIALSSVRYRRRYRPA